MAHHGPDGEKYCHNNNCQICTNSRETITRHTTDCKRVFSRYDSNCPRCAELKSSAAPRKGWNSRKQESDQRVREIRAHFQSETHLTGKCGPVCTFGDW